MASPGRTSSGSSSFQISGENPQTEIRKRKRMLSNRESARRSRMRKQKHLDDLTAQVTNLRAENNHTLTNINLLTQLYLNIESENSVLRAQVSELNHRLQALNDISTCMSSNSPGSESAEDYDYYDQMIVGVDDFLNPWSLIHINQPIMASPEVFMY